MSSHLHLAKIWRTAEMSQSTWLMSCVDRIMSCLLKIMNVLKLLKLDFVIIEPHMWWADGAEFDRVRPGTGISIK